MAQQRRVGDILLETKSCRPSDIDQAMEVKSTFGGKIGTILLNMGAITEDQQLAALAEQFGLEFRRRTEGLALVPTDAAVGILLKEKVFPIGATEMTLQVATSNPVNLPIFSYLSQITGKRVVPVLVREEQLKALAMQLEGEGAEDENRIDIGDEIDRLRELASEAPVIKLVNTVITQAMTLQASDIHFEAYKSTMKVRVRVDGALRFLDSVPASMKLPVIARLKLMSRMNIAESRLPQDGRISLRIGGKNIDIRSSSVPSQFGESFVLRLLGGEDVDYSLESLGLFPDHRETVDRILAHPNGIFLTTGPTGSGKTTTLYSMLNRIHNEAIKLVTVEDPVEYEFRNVTQISVRSEIGYTFATALRSILRQDPDVIMVGEIRDLETAEIAVQSSLTGHLVLSTLHTNSALASLTRLIDLGLDYFLLKASLLGIMAQRLVRRLCPGCAVSAEADALLQEECRKANLVTFEGLLSVNPRQAMGCESCGHTGYKGREAIAEILPCSHELLDELDPQHLPHGLQALQLRTLMQDGLLKVMAGDTSLEEVLRVTR